MKSKELSLYIHIPFCIRKCAYCDFLSFPATEETYHVYVEKLLWEIDNSAEAYREAMIKTIFFGGGTPSLIPADAINRILIKINALYKVSPDAEISMEANPKTMSRPKLMDWKAAGINRLSIGCQSLDDNELKLLGRIHGSLDFITEFEYAREAGFANINVDLMSALPGQSIKSWADTLEKVISLKPEHISAYSLIIEEGTAFYEKYRQQDEMRRRGDEPVGGIALPGEETEREMLYLGREMLGKAGYIQYEISNYALDGYECRHNITYWKRDDYIGFGLGAASCEGEYRWKNTEVMSEYLSAENVADLKRSIEGLTVYDQLSEAMFLGLRMTKGVNTAEISARYGISPTDIYGEWIEKMLDEELLKRVGEFLSLTDRGQDLANYVMAGFV